MRVALTSPIEFRHINIGIQEGSSMGCCPLS
jgi:hypothetical protein